ncbi:MAG: dihydroxyacetone kinase subunit L [Armatimonadota bacterium]
MKEQLSSLELISLLEKTCLDMEASQDELAEIDAQTGDGDLGVTVKLGFEAVRMILPELVGQDIGVILGKCGMTFNSAGASTFGTLMATAFMRAGRVMKGRTDFCLADMAAMMTAAVAGICELGKASQGERTMLDALIPAREALVTGCEKGQTLCEAASFSAQAARTGAESTAGMTAKHGRAGWLPKQSEGLPDAGAVAIAILLASFDKHLSFKGNI